MSDDAKIVGGRISQIRESKRPKITQSDLAEAVGVSQQSVWRWENGESLCTGENLKKVAKALGVHPQELTGEAVRIPPKSDVIFEYVRGLEAEIDLLNSHLRDHDTQKERYEQEIRDLQHEIASTLDLIPGDLTQEARDIIRVIVKAGPEDLEFWMRVARDHGAPAANAASDKPKVAPTPLKRR